MKSAPTTRPKFKNPPVIEVAASIQFADLEGSKILANLEYFWTKLGKDQYPIIEFKQPKSKMSDNQAGFSFAVVNDHDDYPPPRIWFASEDKQRLVQLQPDRLSFNWRKLEPENACYSSYEIVWNNFHASLTALAAFAKDKLGKSIESDLLELLYINMVPFSDFGGMANIERLLPSISYSKFPTTFLDTPNVLNFVWDIPSNDGKSSLKVQGLTASNLVTGEPFLRLDLQQRGAVAAVFDNKAEEIHNWFDEAHLRIVNTFKEITGPEMHKIWELQK